MIAIKLALDATIITMIFIGIMAMLINLIKSKNSCNVCGHDYPETDLIIDKDDRELICKNCAVLKEGLDDEQWELETMMREERKSKALP